MGTTPIRARSSSSGLLRSGLDSAALAKQSDLFM